jgi:holo-[acyl-carrier protein] synthase
VTVLGIGIDVVDIPRFRRSLDEFGERFVLRLFTPAEADYAARSPRRRAERLAARFAAKEAVGKALGCGMTEGVRWTDIEVIHDARGCPTLALHGKTGETAARLGVARTHLSLSHDGDVATAMVVLEDGS